MKIMITRTQADEYQALRDAVHYIGGVMQSNASGYNGMAIQLDLITKKINPFIADRVKRTAAVQKSTKETILEGGSYKAEVTNV